MLLRSITSRQFAEWWAFSQLEPWDCERQDLRAAIVASTVANMAGKRLKGEPTTPADFMPGKRGPASIVDKVKSFFSKLQK